MADGRQPYLIRRLLCANPEARQAELKPAAAGLKYKRFRGGIDFCCGK
jgi:hypothetical protein